MSGTIEEVRAMLALFARSPWRDLHVRSEGWELFFARDGAATNPMRAAPAVPVATETLAAPHLGLFYALTAAGAVVAAGDTVAEIEVLGEREPLYAPAAGRIAAVVADDGALVEYDTPLIRIAA